MAITFDTLQAEDIDVPSMSVQSEEYKNMLKSTPRGELVPMLHELLEEYSRALAQAQFLLLETQAALEINQRRAYLDGYDAGNNNR